MERRDFLKYFGATAATAAASSALAKIPEAEPKIQLLEPKELVTLNDEVVLDHFLSWSLEVDNMLTMDVDIGGHIIADHIYKGRHLLGFTCKVYMDTEAAQLLVQPHARIRPILPTNSIYSTEGVHKHQVVLSNTELRVQHVNMSNDFDDCLIATVKAIGIYNNG